MILIIGSLILMLGVEKLLEPYISVSSLLGIMTMALIFSTFRKEDAEKIKDSYTAPKRAFFHKKTRKGS